MQGDGKQFEFDPNLPKQITRKRDTAPSLESENCLLLCSSNIHCYFTLNLLNYSYIKNLKGIHVYVV